MTGKVGPDAVFGHHSDSDTDDDGSEYDAEGVDLTYDLFIRARDRVLSKRTGRHLQNDNSPQVPPCSGLGVGERELEFKRQTDRFHHYERELRNYPAMDARFHPLFPDM